MTISFRIDRILGERPFAEVGDPVLAVDGEGRGLGAVPEVRAVASAGREQVNDHGMPSHNVILPDDTALFRSEGTAGVVTGPAGRGPHRPGGGAPGA
ncbi:hypothetical protein, partial [Streptomyces sp. NPDC005093]